MRFVAIPAFEITIHGRIDDELKKIRIAINGMYPIPDLLEFISIIGDAKVFLYQHVEEFWMNVLQLVNII